MPLPGMDIAAENHPSGNALRKAYLCNSNTGSLEPGDILLFYRSQDLKAVTTLGVVESAIRTADPQEIMTYVGRRTVYRPDEIVMMCRSVRGVLAILFRQDQFHRATVVPRRAPRQRSAAKLAADHREGRREGVHMDSPSARRVALMSIHPGYAEAILSGRKRAEFRKRPLAEDVRIVLIYATAPVSAIVGWFTVRYTLRAAPEDIWRQLHSVGEICWHDFVNYYSGHDLGIALLVGEVGRLARPVPLSGVNPSPATPQSFNYISGKILTQVLTASGNNGIVKIASSTSF